MRTDPTRRDFLTATSLATAGTPFLHAGEGQGQEQREGKKEAPSNPIRVVVWDEQQPEQKPAYDRFLGNQIAEHLGAQPGISVQSVSINDPEMGLAASVLDKCQVLIWWGHARHSEITPEAGQSIVRRITEGKLSLVALHSAHWSTPFVEAMNERTRLDFAAQLQAGPKDRVEVNYVAPNPRYAVPKYDARITPYVAWRKFPDGRARATVYMPLCCFPAYREDGKPSLVRVVRPGHTIVEGIPHEFQIPQTEMYDEPFHVPEPDDVILEERWATGEWFRSGAIWKVGRGRVFYFRPGHETHAIYKQPIPLRILTNAVSWLASAV
jgi:trehalose utilization protein